MGERLKGKVIIIAGAGGIGEGLARRYASEGARLVLGDKDSEHVTALVRQNRSGGAAGDRHRT